MIVDRRQEGQSLSNHRLGKFAQPANVTTLVQRTGSQTDLASHWHKAFQQPMGLHLTEAPLTVAYQDRWRGTHDLQRDAHAQLTGLEGLEILRNADEPMGIVTGQVGVHQTACNLVGLILGNTPSPKEFASEGQKVIRG
jgi:hypothetical protein